LTLKVDRPVPSGTGKAQVTHISVPKKIVRLATRRNRIRRLIREALRAIPGSKPAPGVVLYLRVSRLPARLTLADVRAALEAVLPAGK